MRIQAYEMEEERERGIEEYKEKKAGVYMKLQII